MMTTATWTPTWWTNGPPSPIVRRVMARGATQRERWLATKRDEEARARMMYQIEQDLLRVRTHRGPS